MREVLELGRFPDTPMYKRTSDSGSANARTCAALEERLAFLLYGNFMPTSPTDPFSRLRSLFLAWGAE